MRTMFDAAGSLIQTRIGASLRRDWGIDDRLVRDAGFDAAERWVRIPGPSRQMPLLQSLASLLRSEVGAGMPMRREPRPAKAAQIAEASPDHEEVREKARHGQATGVAFLALLLDWIGRRGSRNIWLQMHRLDQADRGDDP